MFFLDLPPELRSIVYHHFFTDHRQVYHNTQPGNAHLSLLRVCRLVNRDTLEQCRQYISLRHERQINNFIRRIAQDDNFEIVKHIQWADVANDGRFAFASDTCEVCLTNITTTIHKLNHGRRASRHPTFILR
jgi:hypothetical protein